MSLLKQIPFLKQLFTSKVADSMHVKISEKGRKLLSNNDLAMKVLDQFHEKRVELSRGESITISSSEGKNKSANTVSITLTTTITSHK